MYGPKRYTCGEEIEAFNKEGKKGTKEKEKRKTCLL
jgi:hypothetical protein